MSDPYAPHNTQPLTRITKVKQNVDDLHILIESARSSINSLPNNSYLSRYRHSTEPDLPPASNSYKIHITDQ